MVAREIADNLSNVTRFIVLARHGAPPTGDDKTSFCFGFTTTDRAGTLVGALQELAEAGINMTKVESRPSKTLLGQYIFLVDINGHREEEHVAQALERLRERTGMLKVFGSYPRWQP